MLNLLAEIEFSLQGRVKKKQVAPLAQSIYDKIINLFRAEVTKKVHSLTDEEIRKMGYTR